jgi:tetratricopeptide (TPR) repeat protein
MAPSPSTGEILRRAQDLYALPCPHEDFMQLGMETGAGLFGFYLLDDAGLRKFASGEQMNTDDQTLLEYRAPRSLLVHGLEDQNRDAILREQKNPLPGDFPLQSRDATLVAAAATSINQDDVDGAERFLRALDHSPVTADIAALRGRAALARSDYLSAFRSFDAALAIDPDSLEAAWGLAETNRRFGNNEKAREALEHILQRDPQNKRALNSLKELDVDFSRWEEAEDLQRRLIAADSRSGAADLAQLADILLNARKQDEAYRTMLDCLAQDPYNLQTHLNLGKLHAGEKKWREARPHLEFIMRYFPDDKEEIYPLLFQTDMALGDHAAADNAVRFGLRMFPDSAELRRLKLLL